MKRTNPRPPDVELSSSASEQAYNAIVDLILCRNLRPGERTSVNLLADRLRLGRTPIKEAITRLQAEGVLDVAGRSGTTVKSIGAAEAAQLFALRRTLEEFAADFAVQNFTKSHLARLRELLREMAATSVGAAAAEDVRAAARFVKANVAFHAMLLSAAGNPFLDRLYAQLQLQAQIMAYLIHRGFDPAAAKKRQREHEGIVAALEARNATLLKERLRNHAEGTETVILRALSGAQ
jgi:DNA-binding GntR family transcriptional regulator